MRNYPANSPQAAARIVALTMLADGHLSKAELDAMERHGGYRQLGLEPEQLHDVVLALCEDLLHSANLAWADACRIDPYTLGRLMQEIDDPDLRRRVLALCVQVVEADAHVSDGETLVLTQAVEHWGLQGEMLRRPHPRALGPQGLHGS
jgi:uncharacterized tellurite resistance protein B-like protein